MTHVLLGLGANLGDRAANLQHALDALAEGGVSMTAVSSVYETPPMPAGQPPYLNAVVAAETSLEPEALLALLKSIEARAGRRPSRRWGPRPLDIDILFYGVSRIETPQLTVPHIGITERAFVLVPLAEVHGGSLAVLGVSALELLSRLGESAQRTTFALRQPRDERVGILGTRDPFTPRDDRRTSRRP